MARRRTIFNFDLWIQRKTTVSDLTSNIFLLFSLFSFDCSLWLQSSIVFFLLSWGVKWSLVQKNPWSMSSLSAYGRLVFYFVIYFSLGKGFLLCIFLRMLFQPERIAGLFAVCIIRLVMGTYSQSLTSDEKTSKINTFSVECWTLCLLRLSFTW